MTASEFKNVMNEVVKDFAEENLCSFGSESDWLTEFKEHLKFVWIEYCKEKGVKND